MTNNMTAKNAIRTINDTTARVTKAFEKNAMIFGTEEFKLWREYLTYFPNAKMETKSIKRNPEKKTNRNKTYKNMVAFIQTQENCEELMAEYETVLKRSKIQPCPYQYVQKWFDTRFKGYDGVEAFMASKEAERIAKEAEAEANAKAKA